MTAPRVAIIGGGIAGLTAALRLAQRGFAVELFEARPLLGGNLGSVPIGGIDRDIYPHMFCDWYANFWDILENDLGRSRAEHFQSFDGVRLIMPDGQAHELLNPTGLASVIANLRSGILPPAEMLLTMFSLLDLAAEPFDNAVLTRLGRLDVNGFVYSRAYATEGVASLNNYVLTTVWSLNSDLVAAASYQDFLRHFATFPNPAPFAWLLKQSAASGIIAPLAARLRELGVRLHVETPVERLVIAGDRPRLTIAGEDRDYDHVVLATPAQAMLDLVMAPDPPAGTTAVIDILPSLARIQTAHSVAIPVVELWLNQRLPGLPAGQVGLHGSKYGLSLCDLSQLWTEPAMAERSVLVLAASRGDFIPARDPAAMGHAMLVEAATYLPGFDVGACWGDPAATAIDWQRSCIHTNDQHKLFVNDVGSLAWRPPVRHAALPCLVLAGDYCRSQVGMATVEGAVQTGIIAAAAVQAEDERRHGTCRGAPIALKAEPEFSETTLLAARLAALPAAYAAAAWSLLSGSRPPLGPIEAAVHDRPTDPLPVLPLAFAEAWWSTALALFQRVAPETSERLNTATHDVGHAGTAAITAVGSRLLDAAGDLLSAFAASQPGRGGETPTSPTTGLGGAFAELASAVATRLNPASGTAPDGWRRRWRAKS